MLDAGIDLGDVGIAAKHAEPRAMRQSGPVSTSTANPTTSSPDRRLNRPGMSGDFISWLEDEVMARPSKYPREFRERAVRMVVEGKEAYPSEFEAIRTVAGKLGIGSAETLRKWVRQ